MKVYVTSQGVTLVGKSWQINAILKQYMKKYETIEQWRNDISKR
ncbi:Z-ring formation inhibitor MciZ [Alkalihalobacterium alkalinitrilicum]|nr:Z-ring formation inhibitor MciZ [Alkalihalobacterium alkalinitrilicum]